MSAALLERLRDLIQKDVNGRGLARDPHDNLFTARRDDFAAACRSLAEPGHPAVGIVTGFPIVHANPLCGETDGPLGAIFLARALTPLGIRVALVTDSFCRRALEIGLEACDLLDEVGVTTLPSTRIENDFWDIRRIQFRDPVPPTHLIALERVGPGLDGRCRNMRGLDITEHTAAAHLLFADAAGQTPPVRTIGIGDGGNEIGMGKIPVETIARNIPHGGQIACRVPTDYLIVAGVSNWGAYALAAGVSILRGRRSPASLFDAERERELLRIMVEGGPLVDGVTGRPTVTVDGLSFADYVRPLRQLGEFLGTS